MLSSNYGKQPIWSSKSQWCIFTIFLILLSILVSILLWLCLFFLYCCFLLHVWYCSYFWLLQLVSCYGLWLHTSWDHGYLIASIAPKDSWCCWIPISTSYTAIWISVQFFLKKKLFMATAKMLTSSNRKHILINAFEYEYWSTEHTFFQQGTKSSWNRKSYLLLNPCIANNID